MTVNRLVPARLIPALTAALAMTLLAVFAWPGINPWLWDDLAVATGIREASVLPDSYWRYLMSLVFRHTGFATAERTLRVLGVLGGGLIALIAYGILSLSMPEAIRRYLRTRTGVRAPFRYLIAGGALIFTCCDPVWRACQSAGPVLGNLILTLLAIYLLIDFARHQGLGKLVTAAALLGMTFGNHPQALIVLAVYLGATLWPSSSRLTSRKRLLRLSAVRSRNALLSSIVFILTGAAALAWNYRTFIATGGEFSRSVPFGLTGAVITEYVHAAAGITTSIGWILIAAFTLVPFLIALAAMPRVLAFDRLQSRGFAVAFFVAGVVAWSQISWIRPLWARYWIPAARIHDEFAVAFFALVSTVTCLWALMTLVLNTNFRNWRRIAAIQYGDAAVTESGECAIRSLIRLNRRLRVATWVLTALTLALVLPMRREHTLRAMLSTIDDYCRETARECADARRILTDGELDLGVELAARREGRELFALAAFNDRSPAHLRLNLRGSKDPREREALAQGLAAAWRYWQRGGKAALDDTALQSGYVRGRGWKAVHDPVASGLIARTAAADTNDCARGIAAARALGQRVLAIAEHGHPDDIDDERIRNLFRFVQWRLAMMCHIRNDLAGAKHWTESDRLDEELARRLDDANPVLAELRVRFGLDTEAAAVRISPDEMMRLGLDRADFRISTGFAESKLITRPEDVEANFAVAMNHLVRRRYREAIVHFQRVVAARPHEVAALSDLGLCFARTGDLVRAIEMAERACREAPDDLRLKRNLQEYRERLQQRERPLPAPEYHPLEESTLMRRSGR